MKTICHSYILKDQVWKVNIIIYINFKKIKVDMESSKIYGDYERPIKMDELTIWIFGSNRGNGNNTAIVILINNRSWIVLSFLINSHHNP